MTPTPAQGLVIRQAEDADLSALGQIEPRPEQKLAQKRFDEMTAGTGLLAVATLNDEVVGMGYLDFVDNELHPEVKNLWVVPEARRHGAGQELFTWLEDKAAEAGHKEVFLAVDPNNGRALALFLNRGYSPTGNHLFVDDPDTHQVVDPSQVSNHYAIYQKSLTA